MNEDLSVKIENLTKTYGRKRGVSHISLSVKNGDIFGFLGPNGAGKSTTIRSMLGLLRFTEGSIRLLQMDIRKHQKEILSQTGYLPSEVMFYPTMKAKDVIRFAAQARKRDCGAEAQRICDILEIEPEKKIEELSLGNRKKIGIVCAMQHKPKLLILDEPTSGLDPLMQEAFWNLLLEYNRQGTTCFLSSHVLSEVKKYCRHAAIIKEGKIIRTDTVANLTKTNLRRVKIKENGKEKEFVHHGDVNELIARLSSVKLDDILIEEPTLDEIFMHYYEQEGANP